MSGYWPWWAGAVGLALVTISYTIAADRSFGVSSAWDRVLRWREERRVERLDAQFAADGRALAEALAAATAEHFGTGPAAPMASGSGATAAPGTAVPGPAVTAASGTAASGPRAGGPAVLGSGATAAPGAAVGPRAGGPAETTLDGFAPGAGTLDDAGPDGAVPPSPAPVVTQAALLLSIFVGGLIAAVGSGRFEPRLDMGDAFRDVVTGDPIGMIAALFGGGLLVGFGTRLAGGCSSGHGLNGCGRLYPVSILATAVFFGTAAAVSFLLWKVI